METDFTLIDQISLKLEGTKKTQFSKFLRNEWQWIEKKYDNEIMKKVLDVMCKMGSDPESIISQQNNQCNIKCCGDEFYLSIRDILVRKGIVQNLNQININHLDQINIDHSRKKKKEYNKKNKNKLTGEEIKRLNTSSKLNESLMETFHSFDNIGNKKQIYNISEFKSPYNEIRWITLFKSQYAEIRLITFMLIVKYAIDNNIPKAECYELIIAISKTLNNIKKIKSISKIACNDLETAQEKLKEKIGFKYETMFHEFPRLCLFTQYDNVFPSMMIEPYHSQWNLINYVKTNIRNGFFLIYKAMIGSGKTITSIALAKYIDTLRKVNIANNNKWLPQLLFSCTIEPVRKEVCRMAYNSEIPFGIAVIEKGNVRIINNNNCKSDKDRIMIVADLDATIGLLMKELNKKPISKDPQINTRMSEYIVFLDEPTVGADQEDNHITKAVAKILFLAPKFTILSSATFPDEDTINDIILHYKRIYDNICVKTISSNDSKIGCEVIDFYGVTIAPHNDCKTVSDLEKAIRKINTNPYINRMYTAPMVYKLKTSMINNGITNVIDIEKYFNDIDKLSQTHIQKMATDLLQKLVENNEDAIIEKVCKPQTSNEINNNNKLEYDLNKIFTEHAHKFAGPCLVVVNDPMKFVQEASIALFNKCNMEQLIKNYKDYYVRNLQRYKKNIENTEKNIKNEDKRLKAIQNLETEKPQIVFPDYLRINTIEHLNRFAPYAKDKVNMSNLCGNYLVLEYLPLDEINVPDLVILLLFAGVGIYAPNDSRLNKGYTNTVLSLAADGQLTFLISDDNICYGTNYPFSHVVITDEIADRHSINTIFQLAGRAGRVGESWTAYVHVGDRVANKIKEYMKNDDNSAPPIEATNLVKEFKNILNSLKEEESSSKNKTISDSLSEDKTSFPSEDKTTTDILSTNDSLSIVKIQDVKCKYQKLVSNTTTSTNVPITSNISTNSTITNTNTKNSDVTKYEHQLKTKRKKLSYKQKELLGMIKHPTDLNEIPLENSSNEQEILPTENIVNETKKESFSWRKPSVTSSSRVVDSQQQTLDKQKYIPPHVRNKTTTPMTEQSYYYPQNRTNDHNLSQQHYPLTRNYDEHQSSQQEYSLKAYTNDHQSQYHSLKDHINNHHSSPQQQQQQHPKTNTGKYIPPPLRNRNNNN